MAIVFIPSFMTNRESLKLIKSHSNLFVIHVVYTEPHLKVQCKWQSYFLVSIVINYRLSFWWSTETLVSFSRYFRPFPQLIFGLICNLLLILRNTRTKQSLRSPTWPSSCYRFSASRSINSMYVPWCTTSIYYVHAQSNRSHIITKAYTNTLFDAPYAFVFHLLCNKKTFSNKWEGMNELIRNFWT